MIYQWQFTVYLPREVASCICFQSCSLMCRVYSIFSSIFEWVLWRHKVSWTVKLDVACFLNSNKVFRNHEVNRKYFDTHVSLPQYGCDISFLECKTSRNGGTKRLERRSSPAFHDYFLCSWSLAVVIRRLFLTVTDPIHEVILKVALLFISDNVHSNPSPSCWLHSLKSSSYSCFLVPVKSAGLTLSWLEQPSELCLLGNAQSWMYSVCSPYLI